MSQEAAIGVIFAGIGVYSVACWFWMRWTLFFECTLNFFIFRASLKKPKTDLMHYVERVALVLVLIGFITTAISTVQIFLIKERGLRHGQSFGD